MLPLINKPLTGMDYTHTYIHTYIHTHLHTYIHTYIHTHTYSGRYTFTHTNIAYYKTTCRSQWPRCLRRRSSATRLLRLWVRIPPLAWMFVCYECCVLSGRGLCDGLITRPEESYRLWRVVEFDLETSKTRRLKPAIGM
jgi:hypothetical protein